MGGGYAEVPRRSGPAPTPCAQQRVAVHPGVHRFPAIGGLRFGPVHRQYPGQGRRSHWRSDPAGEGCAPQRRHAGFGGHHYRCYGGLPVPESRSWSLQDHGGGGRLFQRGSHGHPRHEPEPERPHLRQGRHGRGNGERHRGDSDRQHDRDAESDDSRDEGAWQPAAGGPQHVLPRHGSARCFREGNDGCRRPRIRCRQLLYGNGSGCQRQRSGPDREHVDRGRPRRHQPHPPRRPEPHSESRRHPGSGQPDQHVHSRVRARELDPVLHDHEVRPGSIPRHGERLLQQGEHVRQVLLARLRSRIQSVP